MQGEIRRIESRGAGRKKRVGCLVLERVKEYMVQSELSGWGGRDSGENLEKRKSTGKSRKKRKSA